MKHVPRLRFTAIEPTHSCRRLVGPLAQLSALALATGAQAQSVLCGTTISGTLTTGQVCAPTTGPASLTTAPGTSVTTTGTAALRSTARNADATVTMNGTTVTSTNPGAAVSAVQVQVLAPSGATPGNAQASLSGGTNSISVQGTGLDGIAVTNATTGASSITVAPGSRLDIVNGATGNEHDGLDINASGGGNATLTHGGTGIISVTGGNAVWVKAAGDGQVNVQLGAGTQLLVDNTDATSALSNHAGIQTRISGTGSGTTTIDNAATISATGMRGHGIFTTATNGATTIRNSGAISTSGVESSGIRSATTGGAVSIRNSGVISTTGTVAHGIYVNPGAAATGDITVDNQGDITVNGTGEAIGGRGIYLIGRTAGNVTITGTGNITVLGSPDTTRGQGIIISAAAGNANVSYGGALSVQGNGAGGIRADSAAGNVDIQYTGSGIETFNTDGNAIFGTATSPAGTVNIAAQGRIVTHANLDGSGDGTGSGAFGVRGETRGGDVSVAFSGPAVDVNGSGAAILAANAYSGGTGVGTVTVRNSGSLLARGDRQQGIHTRSVSGAQTINNEGAIQTLGASASHGILAEGMGAAAITVVNNGTITTRGNNSSGIAVQTQGGTVDVRNAQPIGAGWGTSAGVSMSGSSQNLANASSIQALSDIGVHADSTGISGADEVLQAPVFTDAPDTDVPGADPGLPASQKPKGPMPRSAPGEVGAFISNTGQIDGSVLASTSAVSFSNAGTWNLRSFADNDGDGVRDTWAVARSNLGTSGANSIANTGTISLVAQPSSGIGTFDAAGAYLPMGMTANAPALGGPVQAQILGVNTFTNTGLIDLTGGGRVVGNVLVIGGGQAAGVNGGGVFVSNGGRMKVNTVLDAGGPGSHSDMLVVDSTRTGAGGATRIQVNNIGGAGALTTGNGIAVVELLDKSAAASDANAFALDGRAVAGAYEYRLLRGSADGASVDAWYLRSEQPSPPVPPEPPGPPTPPEPVRPLYRPEVGAYLSNQRQAAGMFLHSLHDRLGEPQWVETQKFDEPADKRRAGWLRVVGKDGQSTSRDSNFEVDTRSWLIQGGGDVASWPVLKDQDKTPPDRLHLGLMLGYGSATSDASALGNPASAKGTAEGWSVGAYGTWYQNDADPQKLGAYVDLWGTYGWYKNKVEGDFLPQVSYDANALTLSAETGYAMRVREGSDWIVEPQAQLVYIHYSEDDIAEPNGTTVNGSDGSGWVSRLGVRLHRTWVREDGRRTQPYLTINWWHDSVDNAVRFNQLQLSDLYPSNRYEVKLGVNAQLDKGWTGWANLGYQWGSQDFRNLVGRIGAKYTW